MKAVLLNCAQRVETEIEISHDADAILWEGNVHMRISEGRYVHVPDTIVLDRAGSEIQSKEQPAKRGS